MSGTRPDLGVLTDIAADDLKRFPSIEGVVVIAVDGLGKFSVTGYRRDGDLEHLLREARHALDDMEAEHKKRAKPKAGLLRLIMGGKR